MRKIMGGILLACALCAVGITACAQGGSTGQSAAKTGQGDAKPAIVCSIFPAYDWTLQVLGDHADDFDVTYLLESGVDLHSYQPSVADMATIGNASLFEYVGGESDTWAVDSARAVLDADARTVNMLDVIGEKAVEEETVEGMQEDEDGEAGDSPELDEHVWLSLRNAQTIVSAIADEIAAIDPENASLYKANAEAYNEKLSELDASYAAAVGSADENTVVFADRFPFRYLVDDYGLNYFAAFSGCSAETEASFETVTFLASKVDELGLGCVAVIDGSDQRIAQTVIANTSSKDQQIVTLNSLQSVSSSNMEQGETYLGAMEGNLEALETALS